MATRPAVIVYSGIYLVSSAQTTRNQTITGKRGCRDFFEFIDKNQVRRAPRPGEQMHVQIIVSRKDITNTIKLSPMNKSRGRNIEHSIKLGQFNRTAFKESGEKLFDQYFGFDRGLKDTFRYANIKKNGTVEQKIELAKEQSQRSLLEAEKERNFAAHVTETEYLEILLREEYHDDSGSMVVSRKREQSLGRGR